MKALSKSSTDYLFDHILDGFKSTKDGLDYLLQEGLIDEKEYSQMLKKNAARLLERIAEFKNKVLSVFFAGLFAWMQVSGNAPDLRRPARVRAGRSISRTTTRRD